MKSKYVFWKQWFRAGLYSTEQASPVENCPKFLKNDSLSSPTIKRGPQFHKRIIEINFVSKGLKRLYSLLLKHNFPLNTKQ